MILFEVLFTLAFFFTNYVYPVLIYPSSSPYFSLFAYAFNENVVSKATALATLGFCSYAIFQFDSSIQTHTEDFNRLKFSIVSPLEIFLLLALLLIYLYQALPALEGGYSYSEGAGFFRILAIFLCFKRLYNHDIPHPFGRDIALWSIITIYVIVNLLVGNRGDPLYIAMAIFISYELFVKHISYRIFIPTIVVGIIVFFIVGKVRVSEGEASYSGTIQSRIMETEKRENDAAGVLMYGEELIINNRALFVLVDYTDKNGLNYGQTWQMYFYSIIPFLQSLVINSFDIQPDKFASAELTTFLEFGKDNPDAYGLGTNLIGDIYICFGVIGVIFFMAFLGYIVRITYLRSKSSTTCALIYVCLFTISVYYTRAALLEPMRLIIWSLILYKLTFNKQLTSTKPQ